jgi:succinate dehydrogenase / fumarate reductase membrane anchor subunit
MSNLKTPLKRARGLGSAKLGTEHFWQQRLTAVANIPLVLFFLAFVVSHTGASYEAVRESLANQVVIEDYVHGPSKYVLIILNTFYPIVVGAIALYGLVKIAFGG